MVSRQVPPQHPASVHTSDVSARSNRMKGFRSLNFVGPNWVAPQ